MCGGDLGHRAGGQPAGLPHGGDGPLVLHLRPLVAPRRRAVDVLRPRDRRGHRSAGADDARDERAERSRGGRGHAASLGRRPWPAQGSSSPEPRGISRVGIVWTSGRGVPRHPVEQAASRRPPQRRRVLGDHRDPRLQHGRHRDVVEADERDLVLPTGGMQCLDRADRHEVLAGEQRFRRAWSRSSRRWSHGRPARTCAGRGPRAWGRPRRRRPRGPGRNRGSAAPRWGSRGRPRGSRSGFRPVASRCVTALPGAGQVVGDDGVRDQGGGAAGRRRRRPCRPAVP